LRGDVVAVVSHELRTPLTGVYGSAQTLLARYDTLDDAVRRQLLELVVDQAQRLTDIVDRMLLANPVDAQHLEPGADAVDAAAVVEASLATVRADGRARVLVEAAAGTYVRGEDAVRQIVASLVDNALKYSDGPVAVRVEEDGAVVRIAVVDEGPGIPPGERDRVFERFYRLDPDQRRGGGGPGLGLYIARELTQRLGGRIEIAPGGTGTTVAVELPAADGP